MKKKNLLLAIAPIVAIIFAADPNGVTMKWGKRMADGSMGLKNIARFSIPLLPHMEMLRRFLLPFYQ